MPDGWDGLVGYRDISTLVRKINEYFSQPDRVSEYPQVLRLHSQNMWDPTVVAKEHVDVYRKALLSVRNSE